jgi:hypothetical protein
MFFLPEHGVAAVILTNTGGPNPLTHVFQRKLFEALFDGRDEAREDLASALKTQEKNFLKEMGKIEVEPERKWIDKIAGTYEHALFGRVTLRVDGGRGLFDAGEWQSPIGRKTEPDGTIKVALTAPPWLRYPEFIVKEADGEITLLLEEGQRKVLFEPVKKGDAPKPKTSAIKTDGLGSIATVGENP